MMIYDILHNGWTNTPNLFTTEPECGFDEELAALGFTKFLGLGEEFSSVELTVYRRSGFPGTEFLVNPCFNSSDCDLFLVANIGSLIDLSTKLCQLVQAGAACDLASQAIDLMELLTADRGPLRPAFESRRNKERRQAQESKRLAEERKQKAEIVEE